MEKEIEIIMMDAIITQSILTGWTSSGLLPAVRFNGRIAALLSSFNLAAARETHGPEN